jgi:hypothetical protein
MAIEPTSLLKKRVCVIPELKTPKLYRLMVQSLHKPVMFATLKWFTPVPGLGPELCHDRGLCGLTTSIEGTVLV